MKVGETIMSILSHVRLKWLVTSLIVSTININHVSAIEIKHGHLKGSLDTTLSYGQLYRVQSRAANLVGVQNGGTAFSVNGDDGNLNYNSGLISKTAKFTTELDLSYKNIGMFLRTTGFRDYEADDTRRTPLPDDTKRLVERNLILRDLYAWMEFDIGNMPGELRVGEQVLSWGESTFIQNSINTINPVDVSKLRTPGAELREALVPVGIVHGSLGLTDNLSVEAYYQYDWEQTVIDPVGSYFSTNDFVGDGGTIAVGARFGGSTGTVTDLAFVDALQLTRAPDQDPGNGGEYGAAVRWYLPNLNSTELGFYHVNYHSKLPIVSAIAGAPGTGTPLVGAQYFIAYPEDIKLYGLSFNTEVGNSGIALQGEYSFRENVPLQIDLEEMLAAGVGSPSQIAPAGSFAAGSTINGFLERNVSQFQFTATKVFGPILKANTAVLASEFAITHIHNMPSKSSFRLESPGTFVPAVTTSAVLGQPATEALSKYPDSTSWGYRVVGRLDYNNALFGAVNLQPRFAWRHDVSGITPGPGGNFLKGRKAITLGLSGTYQNVIEVDLSYTGFLGDSRQNLIHDRDFTAFSIKYSF